jgi:hypothetical protein
MLALQTTIDRNRKQVRKCLESAKGKKRRGGRRLVIDWKIGRVGRVARAKRVSSNVSRRVESCLLALIRGWSIARQGKGLPVQVRYSIDLDAKLAVPLTTEDAPKNPPGKDPRPPAGSGLPDLR